MHTLISPTVHISQIVFSLPWILQTVRTPDCIRCKQEGFNWKIWMNSPKLLSSIRKDDIVKKQAHIDSIYSIVTAWIQNKTWMQHCLKIAIQNNHQITCMHLYKKYFAYGQYRQHTDIQSQFETRGEVLNTSPFCLFQVNFKHSIERNTVLIHVVYANPWLVKHLHKYNLILNIAVACVKMEIRVGLKATAGQDVLRKFPLFK